VAAPNRKSPQRHRREACRDPRKNNVLTLAVTVKWRIDSFT
jgi:hypothetical protein